MLPPLNSSSNIVYVPSSINPVVAWLADPETTVSFTAKEPDNSIPVDATVLVEKPIILPLGKSP